MSDIKEVQNWVINHYDYLMKLWKLKMETDEFYNILEDELKIFLPGSFTCEN